MVRQRSNPAFKPIQKIEQTILMAKEITLENILGNQAYLIINKKLLKHIGLEATLLLQHFTDLQTKVFKGEFFQTHDKITEEMGIKRRKIENAIDTLTEIGFLSVKKKGLPPTNYFKVEIANVATFLMYDEILTNNVKNNVIKPLKITSKDNRVKTTNPSSLRADGEVFDSDSLTIG